MTACNCKVLPTVYKNPPFKSQPEDGFMKAKYNWQGLKIMRSCHKRQLITLRRYKLYIKAPLRYSLKMAS